jgi:putative transposase
VVLKNGINRYINNLIELYRPARIVVEDVDFRNQELSKRMSGLISNFGKRHIKGKLNRLEEFYKIGVVEVNSSYTSQEFKCKACGRKVNAQVNSAKNFFRRRYMEEIKLHTPKKQVLKVLIKRHLERLKGCNSAPLEVLKDNPISVVIYETP